ncbi:glutamate ABC transporter substrate-binding protein [Cryptosporangium phraense]|uniref:Glutamate ABC transporter substrate-binding protein n=1 Tax=Cryptosporangium phraense TaxID=2593070 RepID=A0A545AH44_9ACTN|nr:glutamate ABC transporter substrate-binding protein [Cryptosporangium phraense]TQS40646.1 glutamate ABC transporter substrate-binding protein [Cryptosporangium phraense]
MTRAAVLSRAAVRLGAAGVVVALLAACGAAPGETGTPAPAPVVPEPLNVADPAVVPSPSPQPTCNPVASFRPPASLPAPNRMPAGSTMARIVRRGRVIVGIDQNAYLLSYRDPTTGALAGFEIDLAEAISRALFGTPDRVQYRHITTVDRIPVLQRREVDMVIRTVTMNCERWQQVNFSTEYLRARQRILVNKGSGITSIQDIAARHGKVCATKGSTSIAKVAAVPGVVPVSTDITLDCLVLLQQGQVDAVSTNDTILLGIAAQDPGTELVGPPMSSEPSGVAIPRDDRDLVRFVNGVLARMRSSGALARSYDRWLGRLGPAPTPVAVYRD